MSQDPLSETVAQWTSQAKIGGRDVLKKAVDWTVHEQVQASGLYPYFQPIEENQGPVARYEGKEVLMLGSNNYLGLTTHPKVREAAQEAIRKFGTSMTGSRFLNGTMSLHEELEEKLAQFLDQEAALVFTTGYQANLGILTALINKHSVTIVDKLAHASIHDGCRLMEGESIPFQHNNIEDLEKILKSISPEIGPLVFVDGVYSMEGDLAPLDKILKLTQKYEARFAVDDAHGFGVMGPGGRGTAHHFGIEEDIDLIVGTFSKSLASIGGFVAGQKKVVEFVKHFGRPMIFSASLPPSCTAAAMTALEILIQEPERVETVRKNASFMARGLRNLGYQIGTPEAAIVPITIGNEMMTFCIWKDLMNAGVYTNPVLYPAVPKGKGILRTSYLATHTQAHLEQALDIFKQVGVNYDVHA